MKRNLILVFTLITTTCFSQKNNNKEQENAHIIGTWIPVFDKDFFGKKLTIKTVEIDTIVFEKNNKYSKTKKSTIIKGTWDINKADRKIIYKNSSFDIGQNGKYEKMKLNDSFDHYGKINSDTMTFLIYQDAPSLMPKYNTRYYVKK